MKNKCLVKVLFMLIIDIITYNKKGGFIYREAIKMGNSRNGTNARCAGRSEGSSGFLAGFGAEPQPAPFPVKGALHCQNRKPSPFIPSGVR